MDGSPIGAQLFDTLLAVGISRWQQRIDRGEVRPDIDLTWAAINSMVLALGTISLKSHVERHLARRSPALANSNAGRGPSTRCCVTACSAPDRRRDGPQVRSPATRLR